MVHQGRSAWAAVLGGLLCVLGMAGCGSDSGLFPGHREYSTRPVAGATRAQVYEAMVEEVRARFGGTVHADPIACAVKTDPQYLDSQSRGLTGQISILSSPPERRRLLDGRVRSEDGVARADVSIPLQRRETNQYRAAQALRSDEGSPDQTPIQRGDNLGAERSEVWTTYARDYATENEILAAIERRFGGVPTTARNEP